MQSTQERRPTGPPKRFTKALVVYLTPEDLDSAHRLAIAEGVSVSEYIRIRIRQEAERSPAEVAAC